MAENKTSLEEARRICLVDLLRRFCADEQFFTDDELERAAENRLVDWRNCERIWDDEKLYELLVETYYRAMSFVEETDPARCVLNYMIDVSGYSWDKLKKVLRADMTVASLSERFYDEGLDWKGWAADALPGVKAKIDLDDPFAPTGMLKTADGTACLRGLIVYSADGECLVIKGLNAASGRASTLPVGEGADGITTWYKCSQLYRTNPASLKALREERLEKEHLDDERQADARISVQAGILVKALASNEAFRDEVTDRIVNGKGYANIACPGGQRAWTKALASDEGAAAVSAWKHKDVRFKLFTAGGVPTLTMYVEGCGKIAPYTDVIDPAGPKFLD